MKYTEEEIKVIKQYARKHPQMNPLKVAEKIQHHFPDRPLTGLANQIKRYRDPQFLTKYNKWMS
ncbi:hypothetical protein FZW96_12115 [Bacillus sp. BGMRC 2118]|nr:hypothetical protein FZW96_12115 [Bacillus sp. BGMRC 2118]